MIYYKDCPMNDIKFTHPSKLTTFNNNILNGLDVNGIGLLLGDNVRIDDSFDPNILIDIDWWDGDNIYSKGDYCLWVNFHGEVTVHQSVVYQPPGEIKFNPNAWIDLPCSFKVSDPLFSINDVSVNRQINYYNSVIVPAAINYKNYVDVDFQGPYSNIVDGVIDRYKDVLLEEDDVYPADPIEKYNLDKDDDVQDIMSSIQLHGPKGKMGSFTAKGGINEYIRYGGSDTLSISNDTIDFKTDPNLFSLSELNHQRKVDNVLNGIKRDKDVFFFPYRQNGNGEIFVNGVSVQVPDGTSGKDTAELFYNSLPNTINATWDEYTVIVEYPIIPMYPDGDAEHDRHPPIIVSMEHPFEVRYKRIPSISFNEEELFKDIENIYSITHNSQSKPVTSPYSPYTVEPFDSTFPPLLPNKRISYGGKKSITSYSTIDAVIDELVSYDVVDGTVDWGSEILFSLINNTRDEIKTEYTPSGTSINTSVDEDNFSLVGFNMDDPS